MSFSPAGTGPRAATPSNASARRCPPPMCGSTGSPPPRRASAGKFATDFSTEHDGLDILVNNAGVMAIPRRETADGFEMQFGTNHLGHFALTGLLLESLLARPGARVVTVSSPAALMGRIRFDDLEGSRRYGKWTAYGQAKLSNQLFTLELHRRAADRGVDLVSVAAHPGYAATNLLAVGPRMSGSRIMERFNDLGNSLFAQPADRKSVV